MAPSHVFTAGEAEIMLESCQRAKDSRSAAFFSAVLDSISKGSPYNQASRLRSIGGQTPKKNLR